LVTAFGLAALLLAALGIYGVLSYAVSLRTREIAIRMTLGARHAGVLWLVARQALGLVAIGFALGLPLAVAAGTALRSLLYGVEPHDASALAGSALVLVLVTLTAALVPAVRASRLNPIVALRCD